MPNCSNILAIGEDLHSPFLTCKPGKDSRFNCREVCYDKFLAILGNERCADQLRKRIRGYRHTEVPEHRSFRFGQVAWHRQGQTYDSAEDSAAG